MSELPSEHLRLPFEINDQRVLSLVSAYAGVPLVIGSRGLAVDPATIFADRILGEREVGGVTVRFRGATKKDCCENDDE